MDVFVLRSVVGGGSLHTTQGGGGCNPQAPPFHVCLLDRKRSYIPTHPQKHTKYTRSKAERERIHINLNTSIHTHVYKLYYYIQALVDYNYLLNEEIFIPKQNDKNAMHFPTYSLGSFPFRVIIIRC